jgi:hypothetical protein
MLQKYIYNNLAQISGDVNSFILINLRSLKSHFQNYFSDLEMKNSL